jgi:hypothetical protein
MNVLQSWEVIKMSLDKDRWWVFVTMVMQFRVP